MGIVAFVGLDSPSGVIEGVGVIRPLLDVLWLGYKELPFHVAITLRSDFV